MSREPSYIVRCTLIDPTVAVLTTAIQLCVA